MVQVLIGSPIGPGSLDRSQECFTIAHPLPGWQPVATPRVPGMLLPGAHNGAGALPDGQEIQNKNPKIGIFLIFVFQIQPAWPYCRCMGCKDMPATPTPRCML